MASRIDYLVGCRIPQATLSEVRDGTPSAVDSLDLLGSGRSLVAGAPEASGPVGYGHYLRGPIVHAGRLRIEGIREIVCMVTDDPLAVDGCSKALDSMQRVRFVSDSGLEFARALDLIAPEKGDRSEHYMLTVRHGVIEMAPIEKPIADNRPEIEDDVLMFDI